MRTITFLAVLVSVAPAASAQIFQFTREQMLQYTAKNPFERFPDGRPKVPDTLLEKVKTLAAEDIFGVLPGEGFPNQWEGEFRMLHPGTKLVGRAVTAQFMPARPDVADISEAEAKSRGLARSPNQRVIDTLQPGDVIVVDLFGKVEGGTFVGDNLATAVYAASKSGMVIDGSIRDLEGIFELPMQAYFRNVHPSAIRTVMLTAVNVPVRIGNATVMPGDVVFGDREGVYFIPPHLVEPVVKKAMTTKIHDEWTKDKFMTGKYKSSELYPTPTKAELKEEYQQYLKKRLAEQQ
jgi:regulator of RNase E activity RraA